jgi:hypothetical protein
MGFSFGNTNNANMFIPPTNTGLQIYAQARLNNVIPRAIQKHANSLAVDGIYFYMWQKSKTLPICTCSSPIVHSSLYDYNIAPNGQYVNPLQAPLDSPRSQKPITNSDDPSRFNPLSFSVGADDDNTINPSPYNQNGPNPLDTGSSVQNSLLGRIDDDISPNELARIISGISSGAISGGDKTRCGICLSSGYVNGYTLYNGQRFVLEASGGTRFNLVNGAILDSNSYPYSFSLSGQAYVEWFVDLPPFVNQWINIYTGNNTKPASPYLLFELYFNSTWVEVNLVNLLALAGQNLQQTPMRVRINPSANINDSIRFTHAELTCMYGPPLLGQSPLVSSTLNWDQQEPLISTNFELLGLPTDIPRETIMQDSRLNMMWKVTEVTKKITAANQVFGYDVNVRRIATSEVQYLIKQAFLNPKSPVNQPFIG